MNEEMNYATNCIRSAICLYVALTLVKILPRIPKYFDETGTYTKGFIDMTDENTKKSVSDKVTELRRDNQVYINGLEWDTMLNIAYNYQNGDKLTTLLKSGLKENGIDASPTIEKDRFWFKFIVGFS